MAYRFATENIDYSDFASGRVFYNAPGHPVFPVRLISEVFQRCRALRNESGIDKAVTIYDPCCGSGYQLGVLGYLHRPEIHTIIGSDIDPGILKTAKKNLGLLSAQGLETRINELHDLHIKYGKKSHQFAMESADRFKHQLAKNGRANIVSTELFQADGTKKRELEQHLGGRSIDIVLADVPYGQKTSWKQEEMSVETDKGSQLLPLLDALLPVINTDTIVAIMVDKGQKCAHNQYQRLVRFQIGKRRIFLLRSKTNH